MGFYRKKPVVIEAVKWTGFGEEYEEIKKMAGDNSDCVTINLDNNDELAIETLEGTMYAKQGDYIIKGVNGELYPCKPDIFKATYERVIE